MTYMLLYTDEVQKRADNKQKKKKTLKILWTCQEKTEVEESDNQWKT